MHMRYLASVAYDSTMWHEANASTAVTRVVQWPGIGHCNSGRHVSWCLIFDVQAILEMSLVKPALLITPLCSCVVQSQTSQQATTKRKRQADSDDEYDGSDSEDEFYDRTVAGGGAAGAAGSGKAAKKAAVAGKKGVQPAAVVESAETLHGKR